MISIIVSLATHAMFANFDRACFISVIISCIVFQIASFIRIGYVDKFILVAIVTSSMISAIITMLVGLPFYLKRKNKST